MVGNGGICGKVFYLTLFEWSSLFVYLALFLSFGFAMVFFYSTLFVEWNTIFILQLFFLVLRWFFSILHFLLSGIPYLFCSFFS